MQGRPPGGVRFGGHDHDGLDHVGLAGNIRTYTEQITDAEMKSQIAAEVLSAERIVFLGFAFHDPNIQIITAGQKWNFKTIFGTGYGMSEDAVEAVTRRIGNMFVDASDGILGRIKINRNLKCAALLEHYGTSLSE